MTFDFGEIDDTVKSRDFFCGPASVGETRAESPSYPKHMLILDDAESGVAGAGIGVGVLDGDGFGAVSIIDHAHFVYLAAVTHPDFQIEGRFNLSGDIR